MATLSELHDISWILFVGAAGSTVVMGLAAGVMALASMMVSHSAVTLVRNGVFVVGGLWLLAATLLLTIHTIARYRLVQRETVP